MRRLVLGLGLSFLAVAIACTGSDPDAPSSDPRGAENQACFENNTCRGTLTCLNGLCGVSSDGDGGTSSTNDAATSSSADAGPKSCGGVGFCESFEGDVGDWYQDYAESGRTELDKTMPFGGQVSLESILPSGKSTTASARIAHDLASNGKGSWQTRVWVEPLAAGAAPQVILQLTFPDSKQASGESGFQLQLTDAGYAIVLEGAEPYDITKTVAVKANQWVLIRFDFDFSAQMLTAYIGDQPDGSFDNAIRANSIQIGSNAPITKVKIAIGFRADTTGSSDAHAWFDDVRFTPQ